MILGEPTSFFLFEALVLGLFGLCLLFAARGWGGRSRVSSALELLVFVAYGLAFENVAVAAGIYQYAPFLLEVGVAPLAIGMGWGVIGFSVMGFSDALNMPQWAKPFLDALLALLIDLGMDAVAIRDANVFDGQPMGMWDWGLPLDAQWFGVPFGNFITWWVVVFLMSGCLRSGRYLRRWFARRWLDWTYPLGALAVALPLFLMLLFTFRGALGLYTLLVLVGSSILATAVTLRGVQRRLGRRADAPAFLVPLGFHLFFLGLLLWRGLYVGSWGVLAVGIGVFVAHEGVLATARRRATGTP